MNNKNNQLAVIFPGQSSEHIGMLSNLSLRYTLIKETFYQASEILGYDMWKLTQSGPINKLHQTCYAQPAVLTASVAIWKVWKEQEKYVAPAIMAGHSLGEYSALVCANSIDFLSAIKLVKIRGQLMQEVSPKGYGAMSVIIGVDNNVVSEFCKEISSMYNQVVSPSGFNAEKNIVISGHKEAVHKVNSLCNNAGAKYIAILPISVASHCNLMKPMINEFQKILETIPISVPDIPIMNSISVRIEKKPKIIQNLLIQQLYKPVRWTEVIQKFSDKRIKKFLEIGPGKVLTKLIRNSIKDVFSISINNCDTMEEAIKN